MNVDRRLTRLEELVSKPTNRCPTCQLWPDPRVAWPEGALPARCPDCGWEPELNIIVEYRSERRNEA